MENELEKAKQEYLNASMEDAELKWKIIGLKAKLKLENPEFQRLFLLERKVEIIDQILELKDELGLIDVGLKEIQNKN